MRTLMPARPFGTRGANTNGSLFLFTGKRLICVVILTARGNLFGQRENTMHANIRCRPVRNFTLAELHVCAAMGSIAGEESLTGV